jgi:type III secretory pathway component EscR
MIALLVAMFMLAPLCNANAQSVDDEFGIWTTFEASKKINKKFKVVGDIEFRTYDFVSNVERVAIGAKFEYKILKWLKANVGYQFHYKHNPEEISLKEFVTIEDFDDNGVDEIRVFLVKEGTLTPLNYAKIVTAE